MGGLDAEQWVPALLVAFGSGFASGLSGFGAGLMMSAFLVPVLGAKAAVALLAVALIVTNAGRLWAFRGAIRVKPALLVLAGGLSSVGPAAWLLARITDNMAELIVGLVLVASVPLRRALAGRAMKVGTSGLVGGGLVVGVTSGLSSGGGVLILPLLMGAGLSSAALVGTDAVISLTLHVARALSYGRFDLLNVEQAALGLVLGVATVPGSYVAAWLVQLTPVSVHALLLEALVLSVGLFIAIRAALALI